MFPLCRLHSTRTARATTKTVHDISGWALDHGLELEALEITLPTLEDVYLQLTGSEVGT